MLNKHSTVRRVRCKNLRCLGFPNYKVGENGGVWTRWSRRGCVGPWKKLKPRVRSDNRLYVDLYNEMGHKRFLVHVLVLIAFVGPCPKGMQCRHFPDSNPKNNWISNLQWGTQEENEADKVVHGTSNHGSRNGRAKKDEDQIAEVRRLYATGDYIQKELAEKFHTGQGWVSMVVNRKIW